VIATSGYAEGPAQPLARFLNEHGARRLTMVSHPLEAGDLGEHRVVEYAYGRLRASRSRPRPNHPPWSYAFDLVSPFHLPAVDTWFGFNCLVTAQGLVRRTAGLARHVVHWNVDFVPDRFGSGPLTRFYELLDRVCCLHSDAHVELSEAARNGRASSYRLDTLRHTTEVIPMGAWLDECPRCSEDNLKQPVVVFVGSLVERMGLGILLEAAEILKTRGQPIQFEIIGGGPLQDEITHLVKDLHLEDRVTIRGFIDDFDDVRRLLAAAAVAVAPYLKDDSSFTRFADPGKLKAYIGAALPILMTDVPPNAAELEACGVARILPPDGVAFADAIDALLSSPADWRRRHAAALAHATAFDWERLLSTALPRLGVHL
jgi:glycosyltransferase involved in cell wall biosynthesis